MDQMKVNATRGQIEDFKESVLWNDMTKELTSWKEGFNREMMSIVDDAASENPSTASVLLHMGDLNGRQKAVDYFLSILDVFLDILESEKDDKEVSDE
jgi:predicted TIM-barrel fold metal-dependent hydrolase